MFTGAAVRFKGVCIDAYPGDDREVFRIGVADDILGLLANAHETEFKELDCIVCLSPISLDSV